MKPVQFMPTTDERFETVLTFPIYDVKTGHLLCYGERVKVVIPVYPTEGEPR